MNAPFRLFLSLLTLALPLFQSAQADNQPQKPNILLIVADDLGYSDLGVFGSEIQTPNIDNLARQGRVLRNFYTQPTCSPTRSELLSGVDHHLAGVGSMLEQLAPAQAGKPGYEGVLDDRVAPLPSLLRDAGYNTYLAGKWHLGAQPDHRPGARGFDKSFALLPGGASHFKQDIQRLSSASPEPVYTENDQPITVPDDFYSSKTYTDKAIEYIDSGLGSGKPFFAYVAYAAPHWPVQAPDHNLSRVRGRYDIGYDAVAQVRFERQKQLGLVRPGSKAPPLPAGIPAWEQLSPAEKTRSARVYEAYAAAVESLDEHIGRLVRHLKDKGELENTVIVFFSDNGAEGNDISKARIGGQTAADKPKAQPLNEWLAEKFDNRLENIGHRNSYVWIGEGWGQASSLPNRLYKGTTTEGGIRSPAFVYYPKAFPAGQLPAIVTVRDILPTLLDLAGTKHPGVSYQGRTVLPVQGVSALPYLTGSDTTLTSSGIPFGFELFGRSALRKDDWKIVRLQPPAGDGNWQLFNLADDPAELVDLAKQNHPGSKGSRTKKQLNDKLNELKRDWRAYAEHNNVVELGYDNGYGYIDAGAGIRK